MARTHISGLPPSFSSRPLIPFSIESDPIDLLSRPAVATLRSPFLCHGADAYPWSAPLFSSLWFRFSIESDPIAPTAHAVPDYTYIFIISVGAMSAW
jgi:hypothetical protein